MSSSSAPQQPPHDGDDQPVQDDAGSIHSDDAEEIYEEEEDDGSRPMDSDSDDDDAAAGDEVISGSAMDSLRDLDGMRVEGDTLVFDPDGDMGGVETEGGDEQEAGEEYVDNSVMQAALHKDGSSVFDVALHPFHPSPPLAVSGGEDDAAYLFETSTGRMVTKLTGHTDSVVCVGFSPDGEFVASGGMDGRVRIWKRVGKESYGEWEFLASLEGPDEVTCMTWHPKGAVLVAGGADSTVWMWQLPSGNTMQVFAGHTDTVSAVAWTPDGKKLLSSSADSTLIQWDPKTGSSIQTFRPEDGRFALENGITALAVHPSSNLAVVGGSEGGIRVVNLIKGETVAAFQGHKEGESVESVRFIDIAGNGVVVSAGTDGKACVWDVTTGRLRSTLDHQENAITSLQLHPAPQQYLITTSSVDATLKTWDVRNGTLIGEHQGHRDVVNAFAVGGGGDGKSAIVSGGDDGLSFIWVV